HPHHCGAHLPGSLSPQSPLPCLRSEARVKSELEGHGLSVAWDLEHDAADAPTTGRDCRALCEPASALAAGDDGRLRLPVTLQKECCPVTWRVVVRMVAHVPKGHFHRNQPVALFERLIELSYRRRIKHPAHRDGHLVLDALQRDGVAELGGGVVV